MSAITDPDKQKEIIKANRKKRNQRVIALCKEYIKPSRYHYSHFSNDLREIVRITESIEWTADRVLVELDFSQDVRISTSLFKNPHEGLCTLLAMLAIANEIMMAWNEASA